MARTVTRTDLNNQKQELAADKRRSTPIQKQKQFSTVVLALSAFICVHLRPSAAE
jgi:hypothetical protein